MEKILEDTIQVAEEAGRAILEFYHQDFAIYKKKDNSHVTDADLASEKIILKKLKKYQYPILSEETKDNLSRTKKDTIWIIDPLDGTNDFIDKTGQFSVMIALVKGKKPIMGVVHSPAQAKTYFALKGRGAYLKEKENAPKQLKVSNTSNLSEAVFLVSRSHLSAKAKTFLIKNKIKRIQRIGSVGVKIGLIAEAKADTYLSFSDRTCQWDTAAPEIILEEAGGKITDLSGEQFIYNRRGLRNLNGIIASNGCLHKTIKQKIASL